MYCHKQKTSEYNNSIGDFWYRDVCTHPFQTHLHDEKLDVYKVRVRELKENEKSSYWAWWENKENKFIFVHPTKGILSICFPYSMELYEKKGDGKAYNVIIEELEILDSNTDFRREF